LGQALAQAANALEEQNDPSALITLHAAPHKWGEGKTHAVSGGDSTQCGRSLFDTPGEVVLGHLDGVDCLLCIRSLEAQERHRRNQEEWARQSAERQEENRRWHQWYDEYLASDRWRQRRHLVFERSKGMCEGCRIIPATQVHHLTYERVGDEMLFDLVAICDECHHKIQRSSGD
jgi:5-methylcytosine-specific restriction endonuclease McrA